MEKTSFPALSYSCNAIWGSGPWHNHVKIATILTHSSMNGIDSEAYARLFIAAPDLLEAAIQARAALQTAMADVQREIGKEVIGQRIETLDAAIAKAQGANVGEVAYV